MRVLVLGGTRFVGRHLVTECLASGDDVTLLHCGRTPSPFAGGLRHLISDRRAPTPQAKAALAEPWDAVIDTCAADLDDVRPTTRLLQRVAKYVLVSTCGVYSRDRHPGPAVTEQSPLICATPAGHPASAATGKLRCESFLRRHSARTAVPLLTARLGLVIGAHDYSERLAYWLERALRGGDMLIPMQPDQPIQLIDAADMARYLRHAIDDYGDGGPTGTVNVAGPGTTAQHLIATLATKAPARAEPRWVGEDFALSHRIQPWTEIPLWLPATNPERSLMHISSRKAEQSGLTYTPLAGTMAACLAWREQHRGWSQRWLGHAREQDLLAQWQR